MKRFTVLMIALVVTLCVIAFVSTRKLAFEGTHEGHHSVQNNQRANQKLQARVNGKTAPDKIPDPAAYEILFRLLSTDDPAETKRDQRKTAYLKVAGFDFAERAAISNAAYEYKRLVEPIDSQVDTIKTLNWPRPGNGVIGQLTRLQTDKDAIIEAIVAKLLGELRDPSKFGDHILNVKRKTSGFATALPEKKVGYFRRIVSNMFTASAQAPGCDALTYVYNSVTVDWNGRVVYGSGSYSMPANNCGHTITLATQIWGGGYYNSGGSGTYLNLLQGGVYRDGYFMSTTDATGFCDQAQQNFPQGNQTDDDTYQAYVTLDGFGAWSQSTIDVSLEQTSTVNIVATSSEHFSGTITFEPSYVKTAGGLPFGMSITPVAPDTDYTLSFSGAETKAKTLRYSCTTLTTNPSKIKAKTTGSPGPISGEVLESPATGTAELTIVP